MKRNKCIIAGIVAVIIVIGILIVGNKVSNSNKYESAVEKLKTYTTAFNDSDVLSSKSAVYEEFIADSELLEYQGKSDTFDAKYDETKKDFENTIKILTEEEQKKVSSADNLHNKESKENEKEVDANTPLEESTENVETNDATNETSIANQTASISESQQSDYSSVSVAEETQSNSQENTSNNTSNRLTGGCYIEEYGQTITFYAPNIINDYHYNKGTSIYWMGANKINGVYVCFWTAYKGQLASFEPDPNFKEYASVYADADGNIIWDCMTQGDPYELGIIE